MNYKNEIVDRLMDNGKQVRVQDGEHIRVQDRVQDDEIIGQVTIMEFLEYCKLPRTRMEMQEFCGLVARRSFTERYLNPLLEKGLLKMTIPSKPKSKNQRYYSEL